MRLLILCSLLACLVTTPAFAMTLQSAKASGAVGEKVNGYLGVVKGDPAAAQLVADINKKRRAAYEKIAAKNKLSLAQVEKAAAEKAINKTPTGQFVESAPGTWKKK